MKSRIKGIKAKEILDSRRNSTVEVELITNDGKFIASVPSGASRGKYEAKTREVSKAIENVNEIIGPKLLGKNSIEQEKIDRLMIELDGTKDKSKLGTNAILPVSIAVCRAGATAQNLPLYQYISTNYQLPATNYKLPRPAFNILNGGAHAENDLALQEFMVIPQEDSFSENLKIGKKIYHNLGEILKKEFGEAIKIGDEGGFSPPISKTKEALDLLNKTMDFRKRNVPHFSPSRKKGDGIEIGLDCAATQFFKNGNYHLERKEFSREELLNFYQDLIKKYPIIFIEDPFSEEDWSAWKMSNVKRQMSNILLIGDDLTVTNKERVEKAIRENCVDGIIIKPNQVGTITETLETVKIAQEAGLKLIVSHRSGETMDDFIADLAVGIRADFIKSGAPGPKERMVKYNRLLKIEEKI